MRNRKENGSLMEENEETLESLDEAGKGEASSWSLILDVTAPGRGIKILGSNLRSVKTWVHREMKFGIEVRSFPLRSISLRLYTQDKWPSRSAISSSLISAS